MIGAREVDPIYCPSCGLKQPASHRFCIRCGTSIPTHLIARATLRKSRWFEGMKATDTDLEKGFLRVTAYLEHGKEQVRFSIWSEDRVICVLSLPISEAHDLERFLTESLGSEFSSKAAEAG